MPNRKLWWFDPELPNKLRRPHKSLRALPVKESSTTTVFRVGLDFKPSKHWKRYTELTPVNGGYMVELYNLNEVARHYGLSHKTKTYWRRFILPDPFQVATSRNHRAYYWSRIQLVVIDSVLRHLEANGIMTIRKDYTSCLELIDHGCRVLEDYYRRQYEQTTLLDFDKFGVRRIG
jgi:hypothetical protein